MLTRSSLPIVVLALLLAPTLAGAQMQRYSLDGPGVAVYNLAGTMRVEGGTGSQVVVEVTRAGADAARLTVATGTMRGRTSLRVRYPSDRIVYPQRAYGGRTTFTVHDDDTFGDGDEGGNRERRRIEVRSDGDGLEAHADLRIIVPPGRSVFLRNGVGETTLENVDGQINVSVASSRVRASHVRGSLSLETGSGGVEVTDMTGTLRIESGSGGAVLDGIRGGALNVEVGSGSLRGRSIEVSELSADVGSGGVRLAGVRTPTLRLDAGSGRSEIELLAPVDAVTIESGSGGVTLRLPASLDATLDVETGSGGIDTDFEVVVQRKERGTLRGTVGKGRGRIRIEAGSGAVRLLRS